MKAPVTIVHLIAGLGFGGAERQLQYLVTRSDPKQFSHIVISMTDKGELGPALEALGIEVHTLGMARGRISIGGIFRLRALLTSLDAAILQTWMYHAGLLGLVVGRSCKVPSILWNLRCSNMNLSDYGRLTGLVVKLCAKFSKLPNAAIVNSQAGQQWHEQLSYHPRRWGLIYNGFDFERFVPNENAKHILCDELGLAVDTPLVGLVARVDPMKGHDVFIKAANIVLQSNPNVHFVLVGKDVEQVQDDGLGRHLHRLGARSDVAILTAAFDFAVSASVYGEGFPNTVGEAMACGVPCVVTDVGDSAYVVGNLGWVVKPRDPEALAISICKALSLEIAEKNTLKTKNREHIVKYFGIENMVITYGDFYTQEIATVQNKESN